jgi:hypothetical protein
MNGIGAGKRSNLNSAHRRTEIAFVARRVCLPVAIFSSDCGAGRARWSSFGTRCVTSKIAQLKWLFSRLPNAAQIRINLEQSFWRQNEKPGNASRHDDAGLAGDILVPPSGSERYWRGRTEGAPDHPTGVDLDLAGNRFLTLLPSSGLVGPLTKVVGVERNRAQA